MTLDRIGGNSYQPKKFIEGLINWRSDLANINAPKLDTLGAIVRLSTAGDNSFGKLIVTKNQTSIKIVHHAAIPFLVGQNLEISFRVKLTSGAAPKVRIIGQAISKAGTNITNLTTNGPSTTLITGAEFEISAIAGASPRDGVDFAWGDSAVSGYFGLEIFDVNGGELLVDNMQVRDVTAALTALHTGILDVRDYGAIGDGVTDNTAAFAEADLAANGKTIFVPEGNFFVATTLTLHSPVQFTGSITCPESTAIMFAHRYDLEAYVHAFKNEELAFRKALQSLFRFSDHRVLDMCGRIVSLTKPIRFASELGVTSLTNNRVLCNGEIIAAASSSFDNVVVTADADYSAEAVLSNVTNIAAIPIGAHVTAPGVGREVYVVSKDVAAGKLVLSGALYGVRARQSYRFERYQFLLDFCEVELVRDFSIEQVVMAGKSIASLVMLAKTGNSCKFMECDLKSPKNRGICSYALGCFGLTVESCHFDGGEFSTPVANRQRIALTSHGSDLKIRNNRGMYFRHFAVMGSSGHIILGNHIFQGGTGADVEISAIFIGTDSFRQSTFTGNYIDNGYIELSKECIHDRLFSSHQYLGWVTITGNTFLLTNLHQDPNFTFIKLRIIGPNNRIENISVIGNVFNAWGSVQMNRAEGVDTTLGVINYSQTKSIYFYGNSYYGFNNMTFSPATKEVTRSSAATTWTESFANLLPFGCPAMVVSSAVCYGDCSSTNSPKVTPRQGTGEQSVSLTFPAATKGTVAVTVYAGAFVQ